MKTNKNVLLCLLALCFCIVLPTHASKTRLIVTSDIGGADPDDQQSLIHLLTLLDRVDLEGFIYQYAWVPIDKGDELKVMNKVLPAYEKVWANLSVHSKGFPTIEALQRIIKHGQAEAAMHGVGEGKDSPGSEHIIQVVDKDDPRPVWIAAWSGMNTLAQALWKVKQTRTAAELQQFVRKIRVYDILGQDDAGAWIAKEFPEITYIRNKEVYGWPPNDAWYKDNIQYAGKLGEQYPNRRWATEGDSPSFLYVIDNGLNMPEHPDWGGWGGRFDAEKRADIRSMDWVVRSNLDETKYDPYYMLGASKEGCDAIRKWAEDINNDFAARMIWTMTSRYEEANHHPQAVVGKDKTTDALIKNVKAGSVVTLDAGRSSDPDGDALSFEWIYYQEPSTYKGAITFSGATSKLQLPIPSDAQGKSIHLVLRVTDSGKPSLTSYRRVVLHVK